MSQNDRAIQAIWAAPPEKRYRNFIHTVADCEGLWLAGNEEGELVVEENGKDCLCLWPEEVFAQLYLEKACPKSGAKAIWVELSDFMERGEALARTTPDFQCMVFPTEQDAAHCSMEELLDALNEELENY